jgi:N-acetylmuramoyl-L-alanine amidase
MHIKNHLLTNDSLHYDKYLISHCPSLNYSVGKEIKPHYIVAHYDAALNEAGTIHWCQQKASKVSYHILIKRSGHIVQLVPFNRRAWHAGTGIYHGVKDMNSFSIGICCSNVGPIHKSKNGEFFFLPQQDNPIKINPPSPPVFAPYKYANNNGAPLLTYFEPYTAEQFESFIQLTLLLMERYPIEQIIGHEDYAPTRKIDPGPAFFPLPMTISDFKLKAEYGPLTPSPHLKYNLPIRTPRRCSMCDGFIWLAYLKPRPETANVFLSSSCSYDILCESCYNK